MKVVTFNIRGDFGVDGANDFGFRKPLILEKIAREQPDVIGFQEVLPHVAAWMRQALPEYDVAGCGRETDLTGEQMTVIFRRDRYTMIEMRTFWLSPTPHVPGSRYAEQSHCPRTATELLLRENATGKVFRVVNTHLDHEGTLARTLGLSQILRQLDAPELFPDAPVLLMGDFNAAPDSDELQTIRSRPDYTNATADVGMTFHDFMRQPDGQQIDYIFVKGALRIDSAARWMDAKDGVYLSDHYPVCVEVMLV
ncbi:MAG: endonuclease/exonuclease/phosphatase family protein [Clostridia bacterium]|nr:endonuclease/exonuclease/phosphatase family protein [Clostridia bacterium]